MTAFFGTITILAVFKQVIKLMFRSYKNRAKVEIYRGNGNNCLLQYKNETYQSFSKDNGVKPMDTSTSSSSPVMKGNIIDSMVSLEKKRVRLQMQMIKVEQELKNASNGITVCSKEDKELENDILEGLSRF